MSKPAMKRDGAPWLPHEDALLGTDIDRVIAAKLGRSSVSVGNRRKKLGIAAIRGSRKHPRTEAAK